MIPGLPVNKLESLIKKAKFEGHSGNDTVLEKWNDVKDKLYSLSDKEKQLGLGEKVSGSIKMIVKAPTVNKENSGFYRVLLRIFRRIVPKKILSLSIDS